MARPRLSGKIWIWTGQKEASESQTYGKPGRLYLVTKAVGIQIPEEIGIQRVRISHAIGIMDKSARQNGKI